MAAAADPHVVSVRLRRKLFRTLLAGLPLPFALASCSADSPSTLDPAGFGARRVEGLWWLLFWIALVVFIVVVVGVLLALRRRGAVARSGGGRVVVVAGVAVPAAILTAVYAVGLQDMAALQVPPGKAAETVEVIGHLWWWEVRYPDHHVVTANEIHIPVGQVVLVRLRTADVNHSFWVPQLTPKTDLIAGRTNQTWLKADRPGVYRGQCAEYCGLEHARMAFQVVAQSRADFDRWLAAQAAPAPVPQGALATRGEQVFTSSSCASCHTVRGTSASGTVGPDLTHVADRALLAAGTVPNTPGYLAGWISNSQAIKPGNRMPPQPLSPDDLRALVAFLDAGRSEAPGQGGVAGTPVPTAVGGP